jgi:hypothetical protein
MQIVSRDEIRLDDKRVQVIYTMIDEWRRKIVNSVILHRPVKNWKKEKAVAA